MREVVIVDGVRSAIAKSGRKSWFANVRADQLGAEVLKGLVKRNNINPEIIEDLVYGASYQFKDMGQDLARQTAIVSGLSLNIPGTTVERFCAGGLQAVQFSVAQIMAGWADCIVAGGTQHMTHLPMNSGRELHPKLGECMDINATAMAWTAEFLTKEKNISRVEQEEFSVWSHQKAAKATREGKFKNEIIPIEAEAMQNDNTTVRIVADRDQGIREDASLESLAKLKPLFENDPTAVVTAGTASQTSDASAALLIMSREKAQELGLKPRLKLLSFVAKGFDPRYTMMGPIYAIPTALARAGLKKDDIDVWEVNEAFAVQSVVCMRELDLPRERLNMWGSGISIGHPLGCTGARMTTTIMNILDDVDGKYGVVSMCAAYGHGAAAVFERIK
ncbi:MAG: thiolase family protein [Syntrophomonas sp.]|nr:thiolase family protein [Syntrophomonas sp.]